MEILNLYNAIFHRKSTRKYKMEPLKTGIINELKEFTSNVKRLDDSITIDLSFFDTADVKNILPIKAPHYICVYSETKNGYLMNAGFVLQQIDLYLSAKGIGSCWLGLAKPTNEGLEQKNGLEFVIMLAFGNSPETIWRSEVSEFKRKELSEISTVKEAEELLKPVRLAPSATNSQPWFFTGNKKEIHLHREKLSLIKTPLYSRMNQVDMGIVACYLYLSATYHGKSIEFISVIISPNQMPKKYQYVISAQLG